MQGAATSKSVFFSKSISLNPVQCVCVCMHLHGLYMRTCWFRVKPPFCCVKCIISLKSVLQSLGYSNNPRKDLYFNMHIFNVWLNIIFQKKLWYCDFTIMVVKYSIVPLSFILKHQNVIFASAGFWMKDNFTEFLTNVSSQQQNSFYWSPVQVLMSFTPKSNF